MYTEIVVDVHHRALWVGINRPEVRNAFREQTLDELTHAIESVRDDPMLVAVVVYGVGGHFSAGGDMHAMMRLNKANSAMWNDRMLRLAMACRNVPVPVIAMIGGYCMGGGHELALWCDIAIAANDATLGQTGAKVGACPTVGATQYIARLIGDRRAKEMIFNCRTYQGAEAAQIGLVNQAVPADQLQATVEAMVERYASFSSQTLRATKVALNFESDELYAAWQHGKELLANVWGTEESLEGMQAFLDGRKPDFDQFRERNKAEMDAWKAGFDEGLNQGSRSREARAAQPSAG